MSQALAVFFVLGLLFGLLWLARRKGIAAISLRLRGSGNARSEARMRVIERVPLSGQHSLHLVTCAGRLLVVAVSPAGCSTLAEFAEPDREAAWSTVGGSR